MNRITSPHLPRARSLVAAFRGSTVQTSGEEEARQRSPVGWPVPRARLAAQLQDRLDGRTLPDQRGTSYCGCAAFLYCLLEDRPDWYVAYATALWRGEPFTFRAANNYLNVRVGRTARDALASVQTGRSAAGRMNELDWMTMACLSAATSRSGDAVTRVSPDDVFDAITWPFMVKRWFASVGAPARLDSIGTGLGLASLDDLLALLSLWESCWLVMEIDYTLLTGGGTALWRKHWVVVDPETRPLIGRPGGTGLTAAQFRHQSRAGEQRSIAGAREGYGTAAALRAEQERQQTENILRMRVVSWADEHTRLHQVSLPFVLARFYGGFAFPRFNQR